jgi:hypothetical protein
LATRSTRLVRANEDDLLAAIGWEPSLVRRVIGLEAGISGALGALLALPTVLGAAFVVDAMTSWQDAMKVIGVAVVSWASVVTYAMRGAQ